MQFIDIVFDRPPGHQSSSLVEVEDEMGHSVKCGTWRERDGYWVLRITPSDIQSLEPPDPPGWEGGFADNH